MRKEAKKQHVLLQYSLIKTAGQTDGNTNHSVSPQMKQSVFPHPEDLLDELFEESPEGHWRTQYCFYGFTAKDENGKQELCGKIDKLRAAFHLHILAWNSRLGGVHLFRRHLAKIDLVPAQHGKSPPAPKHVNKTCVMLFSISGSVGKTQLALTLATAAAGMQDQPYGTPLLIDGDLLGANLTRELAEDGGEWCKKLKEYLLAVDDNGTSANIRATKKKTALLACIEGATNSRSAANALQWLEEEDPYYLQRMKVEPPWGWTELLAPDGKQVITSRRLADETLCLNNIRSGDMSKTGRFWIPAAEWVKHFAEFEAALNPKLRSNLRIKWVNGVKRAAQLQAHLTKDQYYMRRFWSQVFTIADRWPGPVIVDLPAAGPTGLAVTEQWKEVKESALKLANTTVNVIRLFVTTPTEKRVHGAARYVQEVAGAGENDLIVVNNMATPDAGNGNDPEGFHVVIPVAERSRVSTQLGTFLDLAPGRAPQAAVLGDQAVANIWEKIYRAQ